MRQNDSWLRLPVLVLLGVVVWTGWMYERLPQVMVTHWGFWGEPNGWMDKLTGAWILPMIMMLLWALWEVLPSADKRHCQSRAFLEPYWSMVNAVLVLMAAMQWGVFQYNFNPGFPMLRFFGWIFVLFIAWIGRIMPNVPINRIFGVRTPWTLSDSRVWRLTHKETAKGLRTVALLSIIFQVALPQPWSLVAILVSFVGILLWGAVLSFINRG
jgi:uncharacterized membrane protein